MNWVFQPLGFSCLVYFNIEFFYVGESDRIEIFFNIFGLV